MNYLMITIAISMLNIPYIWGGNHPLEGFDCSGFVQYVLQSVGVDPKFDQTAQDLYYRLLENGWEERKDRGSVLFFGESTKEITHTAIMIDKDYSLMIESGGGNINTKTFEMAKKRGACVRIRPVRKDLIASLGF